MRSLHRPHFPEAVVNGASYFLEHFRIRADTEVANYSGRGTSRAWTINWPLARSTMRRIEINRTAAICNSCSRRLTGVSVKFDVAERSTTCQARPMTGHYPGNRVSMYYWCITHEYTNGTCSLIRSTLALLFRSINQLICSMRRVSCEKSTVYWKMWHLKRHRMISSYFYIRIDKINNIKMI